jgi:hypothetical protein
VAALGQPAFASSIIATHDMICGRTEPALETVVLNERRLDRVELLW